MASRVWPAGEGDVGAVASLLAEFRDWWGKSEPTDEGIRDTVRRLVEDPQTDFLLAAPAGADVAAGVCQLRYRLSVWTGANDCWLEDLFVRADARGSGLGRALVGAALERARERGCRRIELDVDDDNASAIALYERMGLSLESKPPGRNYLMGARLP